MVTRWLLLLQQQYLCPRQEEKEGQRERGMCQLSLLIFMRKAVNLLGATPAGLWSPLIGRKPAIWSPLGASRPARASSLSGACLPDMVGVPLAKMKGTGSRWGAVSASILFFLLYCWGKQLQSGFKAYSRPRIWSVKDIWGLRWMFSVWESTFQFRAIRLDPWSGNRSHKPAMQPEKKRARLCLQNPHLCWACVQWCHEEEHKRPYLIFLLHHDVDTAQLHMAGMVDLFVYSFICSCVIVVCVCMCGSIPG